MSTSIAFGTEPGSAAQIGLLAPAAAGLRVANGAGTADPVPLSDSVWLPFEALEASVSVATPMLMTVRRADLVQNMQILP